MKTKQVYYEDPYKTEVEAAVLEVRENTGGLLRDITLDQTVFFPEGGGQPGDKGEIIGKNGSAKIEYTRLANEEVIHQGKIVDKLIPGEKVIAKIDWKWHYGYMRIHSAGHLLHDVLMTMVKGLIPLRGSHGKKAFLEYSGNLDANIKDSLEKNVNLTLAKDLPIVSKETTWQELEKECQFIPSNLPRTKSLRMIKIGDYPAMPDGGVHIKSTEEIGKIWIANMISESGKVTIRYGVAQA